MSLRQPHLYAQPVGRTSAGCASRADSAALTNRDQQRVGSTGRRGCGRPGAGSTADAEPPVTNTEVRRISSYSRHIADRARSVLLVSVAAFALATLALLPVCADGYVYWTNHADQIGHADLDSSASTAALSPPQASQTASRLMPVTSTGVTPARARLAAQTSTAQASTTALSSAQATQRACRG